MKAIAKIAWLQLIHQPWRLAAALSGIAFSAVLILVQSGLYSALFDGVTKLYSHFGADVIMVSRNYQSQIVSEPFPRRDLVRALGVPGVRAVWPFYFGQAEWKNPETHAERLIYVFGVPPDPGAIKIPGIAESLPLLIQRGGIAFDEWGRPEYGPVGQMLREHGPVRTEIGGKEAAIMAVYQLGSSFAVDGSVLTSYQTFFRLTQRRPDEVDIGLIELAPGADPEQVRAQLAKVVGNEADVLTRSGLVLRENKYWSDGLPIGYILGLNMALGLVVGIVIVYQILYTDVSENLPEYATLKALGFPDASLFGIVLFQGLLLSVLGYIPGYFISVGMYKLTRDLTFIELEMTVVRAAIVYAAVLAMCLVSAAMAMRKVKTADPAEIF
jgi:putative ABC transport system permease protein